MRVVFSYFEVGVVADIMKVSLTMVSNYINCKKYPRMDKIKLLADYFGITVSELVQAITPVPGGVGAVTTSVLAKHVIEACERQKL